MREKTSAPEGPARSPQDHPRLDEVVLGAAGRDEASREAYLDEVAATQPDLAAKARRHLAAAAGLADSFLESPAAARLDDPDRPEALAAPPPSTAAPPPAERYELGRCLGQGGMGRVFEAYDRLLGRHVAIKLLTHQDPAIRGLFLHEARAQARVRHDHVLEIYDTGELGGKPYLAMRYVAGGTLGKIAPELPLEERIRLLIQTAEGLHAAHRKGLLHRDVKPSNVLVEETPDGELVAYVSDFGIAADLANPSWLAGEAVAGSPHYIAPERLEGPPEAVDRRADVYSLGVTIYRVLTGSLPFTGPLTVDVLRQTLHDELPPPRSKMPSLPVELEAIILRCLERDPDRRYASARAVAAELQRYLDGEVVEAYAAGVAYRLTRFALRHRLLVGMAAAALVAMAVAAVAVGVFALRADAARERAERRQGQAEELIRFMVVDLQEKLAPVSRLAVLEDVARAALEYFAAVPEEELSEGELLRRSRTLYQLGNLRIQQGDLRGAGAPLRESLAVTRRLHQLAPDDPERLFELGQSWFWVGFVAWERGDLAAARGPFEEYLAISGRLVEIDPENLDWQLELSYAYSNLGSVLQAENELEHALEQFRGSLAIKQRLVHATPENPRWRKDLAASHNTVGVALLTLGRLGEARAHFERELALLEGLLGDSPENHQLESTLATAHAYLAKSLASAGELDAAETQAAAGRRLLAELTAHDPQNSVTWTKLAWNHLDVGRFRYAKGDVTAAEREWREAQVIVDRLLAGAGEAPPYFWRLTQGALHYHLALGAAARDDPWARAGALGAIEVLEALAEERPTDPEVVGWLGRSYLLLGSLEISGEATAGAFRQAVNVLAPLATTGRVAMILQPYAEALRCLGRHREVQQVEKTLDATDDFLPIDPRPCSKASSSRDGPARWRNASVLMTEPRSESSMTDNSQEV